MKKRIADIYYKFKKEMATSYHFYIRKDKMNKSNEAPVFLRITRDRKSHYVATGIYIKPQYWNEEKEIVRKSHNSSTSLNRILENTKTKAIRVQSDLTTHESDSAKNIRARLKNLETGDFFDLADKLLHELEEQKKYHPKKRLKVLIGKVEDFNEGRVLPLKQITTDWLEQFELFLKTKYGNGTNTISKDFEPLHKIIKMALKAHLIYSDPFSNFEGAKRKRAQPKTKLTLQQIKAIESLKLESDTWTWHTRNAFLFSFYSAGIRFGDICCLKWRDVENGRLKYTMNKNEKSFSVKLNEPQKSILSCYKGKGEEYIFPFLNSDIEYDPVELRQAISSKNSIVNKLLKDIAKSVNEKIEKDKSKIPKIVGISFHVSRHSFAQYAVDSGLGVYELMHALRHSKIETTQKYLKSLDEEVADKAMKKLF